MRQLGVLTVGLALWVGVWAIGTNLSAQVDSNDNNVAIVDDCDPAAFAPFECQLEPHQGDVSLVEFNALLFSPLSATVIGHPSWRNEPSYISTMAGQQVRVTNKGGRSHTFTEVAAYGGGFVGVLNGAVSPPAPAGIVPLTPAAACLPPAGPAGVMLPGETVQLTGLASGLHLFQCCIHPWMRAAIRVD